MFTKITIMGNLEFNDPFFAIYIYFLFSLTLCREVLLQINIHTYTQDYLNLELYSTI